VPGVAAHLRLGLDATDIHLALERYPDGPVFFFAELRELPDAISRARPAGGGNRLLMDSRP
jgi:hypothetical protein